MNKPEPASPRQRLQALLAIPERQRTEAEWDEINELEIILAPGNREGAPDPAVRRHGPMSTGHPPSAGHQPGGGPHGNKPGRKFHKRSPRGKSR
jgi:hypothetical protein